MSENFLGAFVTIATLKTSALTARKHTCGIVGASGCKSHAWPFSRPHDLHSQSSVAVIHYILIAPHFICPRRMEARLELVCSADQTRTSCTHERTCVGAANPQPSDRHGELGKMILKAAKRNKFEIIKLG